MKANLFAAVLSLFVVSLPLNAAIKEADKTPSVSSQKPTVKIDLNKADIKTLSKSFKGIGQKRAEAIIGYRETKGGFKSVEELAQVRGLGEQFVKSHLSQLQETFVVN